MRRFSLIVATRNRPRELQRLLVSLQAQTLHDFEVIVVDQSDEPVNRATEEAVKRSGLNAVYLRDTSRGLSRARNIGLKAAKGRIWAFPDDDCWYEPRLLERVAAIFEQDPGLVLLSGAYSEPGRWNPRFPKRAARINLWNVYSCVSSVTFFVRAEVLTGMRFDERIGAGTDLPSAEEHDFVMGLVARGHKGVYDPSLVIYHKIQRASNTLPENLLRRARADTYVLARNALRYRSFWLWLRLVARLGKPLVRGIASSWDRAVWKARWQGLWLALGGDRHAP